MNFKKLIGHSVTTIAMMSAIQASANSVYITEWMYSGNGGEFVELTNLTGSSIDFTGWSYDDESRLPGTFDLSGFGLVADGESVIFTEDSAEQFRLDWGLDNSVKVLGGVSNNIGRNDEINIYGAFNGSSFPLIDSLLYGDSEYVPRSIRTQTTSGRPLSIAVLGSGDSTNWVFSELNDADMSFMSSNGDLGSPGTYNAVPVPAAAWLFGSALLGLAGYGRRYKR